MDLWNISTRSFIKRCHLENVRNSLKTKKKIPNAQTFSQDQKIRYQMLSAYAIHMLAGWITASQPSSLIKVGLTNWFALYLFLTIYLENHTIFQNYENL